MQLQRLWRGSALLVILSACGDDEAASSGAGGAGTTATASSTSSNASQSAGTGGDDPGPQPCMLSEAEDRTNDAAVAIASEGVNYTPRCVRVAAGTQVTFNSNFQMHPLRGGEVVDEVGIVDPNSPITPVDSGATATFVLDEPGEYPYFCSFHASLGMFGTIWVE